MRKEGPINGYGRQKKGGEVELTACIISFFYYKFYPKEFEYFFYFTLS